MAIRLSRCFRRGQWPPPGVFPTTQQIQIWGALFHMFIVVFPPLHCIFISCDSMLRSRGARGSSFHLIIILIIILCFIFCFCFQIMLQMMISKNMLLRSSGYFQIRCADKPTEPETNIFAAWQIAPITIDTQQWTWNICFQTWGGACNKMRWFFIDCWFLSLMHCIHDGLSGHASHPGKICYVRRKVRSTWDDQLYCITTICL